MRYVSAYLGLCKSRWVMSCNLASASASAESWQRRLWDSPASFCQSPGSFLPRLISIFFSCDSKFRNTQGMRVSPGHSSLNTCKDESSKRLFAESWSCHLGDKTALPPPPAPQGL